MKLSSKTIEILSWYSKIQDRLALAPGSLITGVGGPYRKGKSARQLTYLDGGRTRSIHFEAVVREAFPIGCVIPSVKKLLKCIDEQTDLSFDEPGHLLLNTGKGRIVLSTEQGTANSYDFFKTLEYKASIILHHDDLYQIKRLPFKDGRVKFCARDWDSTVEIHCYENGSENNPTYTFEPMVPQRWKHRDCIVFENSHFSSLTGSFSVVFSPSGWARFSWMYGPVKLHIEFDAQASTFGKQWRDNNASETGAARNSAKRPVPEETRDVAALS